MPVRGLEDAREALGRPACFDDRSVHGDRGITVIHYGLHSVVLKMTFCDDRDIVWTTYRWRWLGEREATGGEKARWQQTYHRNHSKSCTLLTMNLDMYNPIARYCTSTIDHGL
jgi:hypothetical protein